VLYKVKTNLKYLLYSLTGIFVVAKISQHHWASTYRRNKTLS